jgi:hypothetical protein
MITRTFTTPFLLLLAVSAALLFTPTAQAVQVTNVAVSKVGSSSAVLVVKAGAASNVTVDYGASPGSYSASHSGSGIQRHEILLDGLIADSTVYYRVTITDAVNPADSVTLPERTFHTTRAALSAFSFGVAGDHRPMYNITDQPAVWSTIVGQMAAENLDFVLNVGDMIYGASADSLAQNVAKWDGMFAVTRNLTDTTPMYTAVGNHEYTYYANSRLGYEQELTLPVNNGADAATYGEHYYSFDNGDTHFIALSTELPGQAGLITGNQKTWLQNDLASTSKNWIVVFMHKPLFSGQHAGDPWTDVTNVAGQQNKTEIHNLFVESGVNVVFAGHEHFYLRHQEDGIQYIISGGGGAPLNVPVSHPGDVFSASTYEHLKVDETGDSLEVTATDSEGATLEAFAIGVPSLSLSHVSTYWQSYVAYLTRDLSVDYSIANMGAGDATNMQVVYLSASNGVSPQTETPFSLSDLTVGASQLFTIHYTVPQGVSIFRASSYVTCDDLGGNVYSFPGPAPVY